jgi:hypothetical protein
LLLIRDEVRLIISIMGGVPQLVVKLLLVKVQSIHNQVGIASRLENLFQMIFIEK